MKSRRRRNPLAMIARVVFAVVLVGALSFGGFMLGGFFKMRSGSTPTSKTTPSQAPSVTGDVTPGVTSEPTPIDKSGLERDLRVPIEPVVQKDPDVQNILLIGVDRRNTESLKGNSDTMMIISVDRKNKTMKLLSILRDCYVTIVKDGKVVKGKINAAYAYGGPGLTINTLNRTFDLDIQKYVLVDFMSAEQVITVAGGLELDIRQEEIANLNQSVRETNEQILPETPPSALLTEPGLQQLDARQVISYARIRKVDLVVGDKVFPMDMGRVERQKIVLRGLMRKFFDADLLKKASVMTSVFDMVETNLRLSDVWSLTQFAANEMAKDTSTSGIQGFTIPSASTRTVVETPTWCFIVDFNKAIPELQQFIWGKTFEFTPRDSVSP
jgi:polyisoprenyl-teichoic acid--peptidoglycan teichoic acid transferase